MAHYAGAFYGYRERESLAGRRSWIGPPKRPLGLPKLDPVQIDALETPTFGSRTFGREFAEDEFPDDFVLFGYASREVVLWLEYASVDVIYTFDGETPLETRTLTASYRAVEAVQGYKIRNSIPGVKAWYQLIAFW